MELMADIVAAAPWVPEDDLRLKNAVEAGASLESLAKGAVRFSRKYTLTELRDRWQSLLYDPDISAKASSSMIKLEQPAPTVPSKSSGSVTTAKRKVQSIRRQYNALRKRLCREMIDSFDRALHDEMNIVDDTGDGGVCEKDIIVYDESLAGHCLKGNQVEMKFGFQETGIVSEKNDNRSSSLQDNVIVKKDMNNLIVDNLVDYRNCSGLEEVGASHSLPDAPLWKTIEDVTAPTMPVHVSLENKGHRTEEQLMLPDHMKGKHASDVLDVPNVISREDIAHLSDSLLNFTNDDELLFMDIDGKDAPDKSCYDNLDSLLLNSPSEIQGNDVPDVRESQKPNKETKLPMPSDSSANGSEVIANSLNCSGGDLHSISNPSKDIQSAVAEQSLNCADHGNEFTYCVLNTEDPDVPSNDDIGSTIIVPSSATQPTYKEAGFPVSSSNNQRNIEPEMSLKKEGKPSHTFTTSQMIRPELVATINSNQPPAGVAIKTEIIGRNLFSAVSRQGHSANVNPSQTRLDHAGMKSAADGRLKEEEIDASASSKVYAHSKADKHNDFPKTETNPLIRDQEKEEDDDDDGDDEDDSDIPYFSDIEAMILQMDLCPTDQDSNAKREVSRYQHEDSKRTIMRLEQCAHSFVQRAIASRGALAVLYGRNLEQYIKKSEVILGRATDDIKVDIDLGREGRANKISRRQALIRMEANGSFIIKNIGKSSVFVNGKEVVTGQMRGLSSKCLIQIRDMAFIFEINNKCVRMYLDNVDKKSNDINKFNVT
ncbi:Serine/threonine protein kinase [Senna tora]|uniref:Serine/threonine protein kinase n=1 Tax=Senna tora TaxID=362788 RepID=A0A834WN44_9FABA|nr:Serine/threonine protein kinase [Senna tora]